MSTHLTGAVLASYVAEGLGRARDEALPADVQAHVEAHVGVCAACRAALAHEASLELALYDLADTLPTPRRPMRAPRAMWMAVAAAAVVLLSIVISRAGAVDGASSGAVDGASSGAASLVGASPTPLLLADSGAYDSGRYDALDAGVTTVATP